MDINPQICATGPERSDMEADTGTPAPRDRRMHLRAYNHWASMLGRRRFPTVADLSNGTLSDIASHSVLLDFSTELDGPTIAYLGERLANESSMPRESLRRLEDAPANSLLARLAGHYSAVLINRAPTGFEAEFVGLRGLTMLYRGILLPFSSDDHMIDFVLAVVNWKELTEEEAQRTPRKTGSQSVLGRRVPVPATLLPDWADGPGGDLGPSLETLPPPPGELDLPVGEAWTAVGQDAALPQAVVDQLRKLPPRPCDQLSVDGAEFGLAMIRRTSGGSVSLVGEIPHDPVFIEEAARRLAS